MVLLFFFALVFLVPLVKYNFVSDKAGAILEPETKKVNHKVFIII
jgi:hypothetical protein